MVLGLLTIAGIPTTIGVSQAVSAQKKQNAAAKEKARFHLSTELAVDDDSPVQECWIVLVDGRLYIDHPAAPAPGHKFNGYYFPYPSEEAPLGLVSTIADDPPMLNWIFEHTDDGSIRHAGRKETLGHKVGPWGWSDDETWLTLDGQSGGFIACEDEETGKWTLAVDRERSAEGIPGRPVVEDVGDDEQGAAGGSRCWASVKLRRRMELGMDSRWVRDSEKNKR